MQLTVPQCHAAKNALGECGTGEQGRGSVDDHYWIAIQSTSAGTPYLLTVIMIKSTGAKCPAIAFSHCLISVSILQLHSGNRNVYA